MRALLLAAGLGTRLKPLTDVTPKCLVPINSQPLLEIWLDRLTEAGIGPFLINTHYLAKQVALFVEQSRYKDRVAITAEPTLLGTAGTLIANLNFFQADDGLLVHADNYCLADFKAFVTAHKHRPSGCLMTMMTFRTDNPTECGIVETNQQGVVVGFHEKVKSPPGNLANGAVYILSAEFLKELHTKEWRSTKDFSTEVLNRLLGRIYSYETRETFLDIGTPNNYALANRLRAREVANGC
jgi:mannose-1-phosphate guanylyltransferase